MIFFSRAWRSWKLCLREPQAPVLSNGRYTLYMCKWKIKIGACVRDYLRSVRLMPRAQRIAHRWVQQRETQRGLAAHSPPRLLPYIYVMKKKWVNLCVNTLFETRYEGNAQRRCNIILKFIFIIFWKFRNYYYIWSVIKLKDYEIRRS